MDGKLSGRLSLRKRLTGRLSVMPRGGPLPVLKPITATENGIYAPTDYDADGFSQVRVDVGMGYKKYLYYRLYITEFSRDNNDGQTFQNIARFLVIGDGGIDMAQAYGVDFTANSVAEGSSAANAFDGNPETLWESDWQGTPDTTGWVRVEMDRPREAVAFILYTRLRQRDYPHEALIQGSNDGAAWDTLFTINETTANRGGWQKGCHRSFTILSDNN